MPKMTDKEMKAALRDNVKDMRTLKKDITELMTAAIKEPGSNGEELKEAKKAFTEFARLNTASGKLAVKLV